MAINKIGFISVAAMAVLVMPATAQVPVIDRENLSIARDTANTTNEILETNKEMLTTVEDTLKAVIGDRSSVQQPMQDLAVGSGFSVGSMPDFSSIMSGGVPNFGSGNDDIATFASLFINGMKLVKSLSGEENSGFAGDKSYEQLMNTVMGVSALVKGTQEGVTTRRDSFDQASQQIGKAEDIKGSIDQNTQLQVQAGLTINELIGVMNGAVSSLQADNVRTLTDISNTTKGLEYDRGREN